MSALLSTGRFVPLCLLAFALLAGCSGSGTEAGPSDTQAILEQMEQLQLSPGERARIDAQSPDPEDLQAPQEGRFEVEFETTRGTFVVEVDRSWAPRGAEQFHRLVQEGFYDDCAFFRVVKDFVIQFGLAADPVQNTKWRTPIPDDPGVRGVSNNRGTLTFATSGENTRTTQLFVNTVDNERLDFDGFTPFGRVTSGMEVVDSISSEHGEQPDQQLIQAMGNSYLKKNFPKLDYVIKATIRSVE